MHTAIIMDGNGRWATRRHLNRQAGHRAGAKAVDAVVRAAVASGVDTLTLYALSSDNWQRPRAEIAALLGLLRRYLITQTDRCLGESIRVNVIGRRDRLEPGLLSQIDYSERMTAACTRMQLRIAVDYSSRRSLVEAGLRLAGESTQERGRFPEYLAEVDHSLHVPDVDLLIRTGGEQRLSDFLLWECAYAELIFVDRLWPDFDESQFRLALAEFSKRQRRFGKITSSAEVVPDHA